MLFFQFKRSGTDGNLYLLASQSPWSGDYYNEELDKHPSGLYVSHDDGMSFEYVGEQEIVDFVVLRTN